MTTQTSNPDPASAPLTGEVSGDFTIEPYEIDPEDQELADEITNFDPVFDVSSPVVADGSLRLPSELKASMLSPDKAAPILAELAQINDPVRRREREHALVGAALYQNSFELRVLQGPGTGTNAYRREALLIRKEQYELERERAQLDYALAEFNGAKNVTDPLTGTISLAPVPVVQGDARKAKEARVEEIGRQLALLNGIEKDRRLAKALKEAVAVEKAKRQQLADNAEVDRRAREQVREDRINERAAVRAKTLRGTLG